MISDSQTRYGSGGTPALARQGRSRRCRSYQARSSPASGFEAGGGTASMRLDSEPAPAIQGGARLSPERTDGPSEAPRRFHRQLPRSGAPRAGLCGLRRDHGLARDRRRPAGDVLAPGSARMAAPRAARSRRAAGAGGADRARRERLRARAAAPRAAPHRAHQRPLRLALRRPAGPQAGPGAPAQARSDANAQALGRSPRKNRPADRRHPARAAWRGAYAAPPPPPPRPPAGRKSRWAGRRRGSAGPPPPAPARSREPAGLATFSRSSKRRGNRRPSRSPIHAPPPRGPRSPRLGRRRGRAPAGVSGAGAERLARRARGAGPARRRGARAGERQGHDRRVRLAHLLALRGLPQGHLAGAEEALHRHRAGALHPARVPARPARQGRLHAGALRRRGEILSDHRPPVRSAERLGVLEEAPRRAAADDAPRRVFQGKIRELLAGFEAL